MLATVAFDRKSDKKNERYDEKGLKKEICMHVKGALKTQGQVAFGL
jgi:hypothetical protein